MLHVDRLMCFTRSESGGARARLAQSAMRAAGSNSAPRPRRMVILKPPVLRTAAVAAHGPPDVDCHRTIPRDALVRTRLPAHLILVSKGNVSKGNVDPIYCNFLRVSTLNHMTTRAPFYRTIFGLAALYNFAFGLWAGLFPYAFFDLFHLRRPLYPAIWSLLGLLVGPSGLAYAYAALRLERATPFIAIGLVGKVLGPIGWVLTVRSDEWPLRTFSLVLFNDIVWWLPFALFLLDDTRFGARVRAAAAPACASLNAIAFL